MGVSFDLFGTLVTVDRPAEPADAVAAELERRGVPVPEDWPTAYGEPHLDVPTGAEVPLPAHVEAALASRGGEADAEVVDRAVRAAFDTAIETVAGANEAIAAAGESGPVAICSNCAVPGLVERTLERATFDADALDAVVTSVDCGYRKPAPAIFETTASRLGVRPETLVHVGDDPRTDGGVERVGGTAVILESATLDDVPGRLADRATAEGRP